MVWDEINLQDEVEEARAELYRQQARKLRLENEAAEVEQGKKRRGERFHRRNHEEGTMIWERRWKPSTAFAKTVLTEEQVYIFSVRLCDNEVDRDLERFAAEALETLGGTICGEERHL